MCHSMQHVKHVENRIQRDQSDAALGKAGATAVLIKALKLTRRNVTVCVANIGTFKEQNGRRRKDVVG